MTNAMKAVESAAQVPAAATEPKIEDTFDSLFKTKVLALKELYGIVSVEVCLTALKEIGDWAKKNGRMQ